MVVIYHLSFVEQKYGGGLEILGAWAAAGQFGVDLFFVISGYIMVYSTRNDWGNFSHASTFAWRRLLRVYPVYWQFLFLVMTVWLIRPEWVNTAFEREPSILKSFFLWPQATPPLLAVGWSLIHELYFYLVMLVVFFIQPRWLPVMFLIWGAFTLLLHFSIDPARPELRLLSSPFTLEFIAGGVAAWFSIRHSGNDQTYLAPPAFALFLLICFGSISWAGDILKRVLTVGLAASMLIYAASRTLNSNTLAGKMMAMLGDASYSLYLSHVLVLSAAGRLWQQIGNENLALHCIWLMAALMLTSLLAVLNYQWIESPLHAYVKRRFP